MILSNMYSQNRQVLLVALFLSFFIPMTAQRSISAIVRYRVVDNPRFNFVGSPSDTALLDAAPKKEAEIRPLDDLREYPGGFERFTQLFDSLFLFSERDWARGFAGEGFTGFTVDAQGRVVDVVVVDSLTAAIDDEIQRVLTTMPRFYPRDSALELGIIYRFDLADLKRRDAWLAAQRTIDTLQPDNAFLLAKPDAGYGVVAGWVNAGLATDSLSRYLKNGMGLGFSVDYVRKKWHYGFLFNTNFSRLKQEFERDGYWWLKDTAVRVNTIAFKCGYLFAEDKRFRIEPYALFPVQYLRVADQTPDTDIDNMPGIFSFFPNLGINIDYKYKRKVTSDYWGSHHLNNTAIRFNFAVSPLGFRDNRRGTLIQLGLGLSFHQRPLSIRP